MECNSFVIVKFHIWKAKDGLILPMYDQTNITFSMADGPVMDPLDIPKSEWLWVHLLSKWVRHHLDKPPYTRHPPQYGGPQPLSSIVGADTP